MQYQVPQFIEMEDKIIGPLTLKQFGFVAVAGVICFIFFKTLTTTFAVILSLPVASAAMILAFGKIKGISALKYISSFIKFSLKPQLYLWKKK